MLKKIIGITLLVGLAAVLILGAANRTQAKAGENQPRSLSVESSGENHALESNQGEFPAQNGGG